MSVSDYRRLKVWEKAHRLAMNVERVARRIKRITLPSLRSQMVRAALSVPSNIVEGRSQKSELEFRRFLNISVNSGRELDYHLEAARDTGAITDRAFVTLSKQSEEVRKMLTGLIDRLTSSIEEAEAEQKRRKREEKDKKAD